MLALLAGPAATAQSPDRRGSALDPTASATVTTTRAYTSYLAFVPRDHVTPGGSPIGPAAGTIRSILALSDDTLIVGADEGVYRTGDRGATWVLLNDGWPNHVGPMAANPITPTVLWAGAGGAGLYRTGDAGLTWTRRTGSVNPFVVSALAINPARPQQLFAGTWQFETVSGNVYRTEDEGQEWVSVLPPRTNARAIVVDPVDPRTVYVLAHEATLLKSADGGISWEEHQVGPAGLVTRDLAVDPQDHRMLYAATDQGVYGSANEGADWQELSLPARAVYALAIRSGTPATLFAAARRDAEGSHGACTDIYSTVDRGQRWQLAFTVPDAIHQLAVAPGSSRYLFGIAGRQVWAFGPVR